MSIEFASAGYTAGQLNAVIKLLKKQAGEDGPERFLRGEITVIGPVRLWHEQDGVVYFSVTSDGTTGEDWITRRESKGFYVGNYAKQLLRSPDFKPTNGVTTEVAVLKGMLFEDNGRVTKKIRAKAAERKFASPNAEIACLIREKFTDKEIEAMGLWYIVAMHQPINGSSFVCPSLLGADSRSNNGRLNAYDGGPDDEWGSGGGFAFAVSQIITLRAKTLCDSGL